MKKIRIILFAANLLFAAASCAELTQHAENGTFGCRRSFGYGVYNAAANKTVICWPGEKMSIYVREFDHNTRKWSDPVKAHGLNYTGKWDYHNYPCIALAPDGHYLIFYCDHSEAAYIVKSPAPNTIAGTWSQKELSRDKCTYPAPVVVNDEVYFFYSSTVSKAPRPYRPYRMIKSTDNGETWSEPLTLVDSGNKQEENYDEVYAHGFCVDQGKNGKAPRILLGWEMTSGPKGHNVGGYGNFFSYFNCEDQKMYTAGDKDLGSTVDLEEMFSDCIINDAKDPDSRLFGYTTFPELLPDGSIAVLYMFKGEAHIANWKNNAWVDTEVSFDGKVDDYQRTTSGAYVALAGGYDGVAVWESANGVTDWKKKSVTKLPAGKGANRANKGFIDDFQQEVEWMSCTFNQEQRHSDYSGKWPVYTFGTKGPSTAGTSQNVQQKTESSATN